ncbi:fasciclin [Micractinium conductrix]|uniref:Fasciclin n=1 Tax=Micractinium conductrix TaxID=554055 RepID=A0A2P6VQW2_9CHLO|nr:fasciclin [Micractinium conductrix]|eukprot:PSC76484.1 fasciclin [Micractinium conductrix]
MAAFKSLLALVALLVAVGAVDANRSAAADSVAAFLKRTKGFGHLLEVVLAANASIVETLSKPDLVATVFAPDDDAFGVLLKDLKLTKKELLANKDLLTAVLSYHVIGAKVMKKDLKDVQVVQTLLPGETGELKITTKAWEHTGHRWVYDVRLETTSGRKSVVTAADITVGRTAAEIAIGKKGAAVIHVVDRVLIPGDKFFNWSTKSTMP